MDFLKDLRPTFCHFPDTESKFFRDIHVFKSIIELAAIEIIINFSDMKHF